MMKDNLVKEQEKQNELMIRVIERFLFHSSYETNNPDMAEMAAQMRDLDLLYMWMLTQ